MKSVTLHSGLAAYGSLILIVNLNILQASSGGTTYAYCAICGWYSSSGVAYAKIVNRNSSASTCNINYGIQVLYAS